jgi:chemotaxis response regulator CheB
MPTSAVDLGCVNLILPLTKIAFALTRLATPAMV